MVHYTFNCASAHQQYIQITATFQVKNDQTIVHLPSWRPGRYELGNFAKNIKAFKVLNASNQKLNFSKITKDSWQVDTINESIITVSYHYFAADLNAGSSYLSPEQLYVNPVNCCVYVEGLEQVPCTVEINIPSNWEVATAMEKKKGLWNVANFDRLADSPFICSASLQKQSYKSGGTNFHIWFNGEILVDWDRLLKDFKAFTDKQIDKFKEFPVADYHFLCQIVPYKAYHGVEHCDSTVILLGPSYDVFGSLYKELLGVSSHELYHTWNVKAIRPIELFPYNFKQENYSKLGYICEGITTYMGDLFLLKSGVFSFENYLVEFKNQLQKHFDNPARFNYSVAESSFDTWLDGYVPGAPGRKVSIYTEGCLLAFVMDVKILKATINRFCLDDVMRVLYFDYALKGKGVSEEDFKEVLIQISGVSFDDFFNDFIHGTQPYESILAECLDYLGLELLHRPHASYAAGKLGLKVIPGTLTVASTYIGSPSEMAGIMLNDEVLAVNGILCQGELDKWLNYFDSKPKIITVIRSGKLVTCTLPELNRNFYFEYYIQAITTKPTKLQVNALDKWMK